ncbi:MAG TPA: universal stress protein [Noviherbaspirillum sp.]
MEQIRKIIAISRVATAPTPAQVRALVLGVALGCESIEMLCLRTGMLGVRAVRSGRSEAVPVSSMLGALRLDPFVGAAGGGAMPAVTQTQEAAGARDVAQRIADSGADLIVVDDQDEGFFNALICGYSIDDLLDASRTPLLIVKRPARLPYHKVLVSTDFSPASQAAARVALAVAPRAQVSFLHVLDAASARPSGPRGVVTPWRSAFAPQQEQEAARRSLDALIAALGPRRQLLSRVLATGPVDQGVASYVDKLMPDLVALGAPAANGSRRGGRLLRWLREQNEVDVLIAQPRPEPEDWSDLPAA